MKLLTRGRGGPEGANANYRLHCTPIFVDSEAVINYCSHRESGVFYPFVHFFLSPFLHAGINGVPLNWRRSLAASAPRRPSGAEDDGIFN